MKIEIIEKSEINKKHTNGGLTQQAIFKKNNTKFKYVITTDSYDFQSSAKIYAWTDYKGFELIISKQLKDSYGQNPTHLDTTDRRVREFFKTVEDDLINIADKFSR